MLTTCEKFKKFRRLYIKYYIGSLVFIKGDKSTIFKSDIKYLQLRNENSILIIILLIFFLSK